MPTIQSAKSFIKVGIILLTPICVAAFTYLQIQINFLAPLSPADTQKVLIEIPSGKSIRSIGQLLHQARLIKNPRSIAIIARVRKDDTKINAGEYEFAASMTPMEILKKLVDGDIFKRKVTLLPGMSIWELGAVVEQAGLTSKEELNLALTDPNLLKKAGINANSFEGYLMPETYFFSRPISAKDIIWRMLEEGEKNWPEQYSARAEVMKLTRHEVLTLASIIEKETSIESEKPLISSVFHNRLRLGMKLQADPTVIYGIKNFNGNITKKDLATDHPYNTYTRIGLPIGPIANSTESSIRATLSPDDTEYLFFVADGKGGHVFSTSLRDHNRAVNNLKRAQSLFFDSEDPSPEIEISEGELGLDESAP